VAELAEQATEAFYDEAKGVACDLVKPVVLDSVGVQLLGQDLAGKVGAADGMLDVVGFGLPCPPLTSFGGLPPC
jgi:hypothetical protein